MHTEHPLVQTTGEAPRNRRGRGFTLVELLVVVSIIALLISILLPSLNQAREAARAVKCMSILNQFGQAETFYENEYDGWTVPASGHLPGVDNHLLYYEQPIFRRTMGMPEGRSMRCAERGQICPNADYALSGDSPQTGPNAQGLYPIRWAYGHNDTQVGNWGQRSNGVLAYHKGDMRRPQAAMNFMDAMEFHIVQGAASKRDYARFGEISLPLIGWGDVNTAWRHNFNNGHGNLNATFFDGHAESLKDTDLTGPGANALWRPIDWSDVVPVFEAR